jgi:hypothetical protein
MSAPITQAHYDLRRQVLFYAPDDGAQLIADSEARAVAQWSGGLDQSLPDLYEAAKAERDQLRDLLTEWKVSAHIKGEAIDSLLAECDRLRAEVERLGRATTNGQVNWMQESERQQARADRAEAEIKDRAAMMRDVMRERDAAETELAAENARLDWLESDAGMDFQWSTVRVITRAAIDAEMKEGAK